MVVLFCYSAVFVVQSATSDIAFCRAQLIACLEECDPIVAITDVASLAARIPTGGLIPQIQSLATTKEEKQKLNTAILESLIRAGKFQEAREFIPNDEEHDSWRISISLELMSQQRFSESAVWVQSIKRTEVRAMEWFQLAAEASNRDRHMSDLAMGRGDEIMGELGAAIPGTRVLPAMHCIVARLTRNANEDFAHVCDETLSRYNVPNSAMDIDYIFFCLASQGDSTHLAQCLDILMKNAEAQEEEIVEDDPPAVEQRLTIGGDFRAYLETGVKGVADCQTISNEIARIEMLLRPFELDRTAEQRLVAANLEETDLNWRLAEKAVRDDRAFLESLNLTAVFRLSRHGRFKPALELLSRCGERYHEACIAIAGQAIEGGHVDIAVRAVELWTQKVNAIPSNAYFDLRFGGMIPVLRTLNKRDLLHQIAASSKSAPFVIDDLVAELQAERAEFQRQNGSSMSPLPIPGTMPAGVMDAMHFAELRAAVDDLAGAEAVYEAIAHEAFGVPDEELNRLSARFGQVVVEVLGEDRSVEFANRIHERKVYSSLLRQIANSMGSRNDTEKYKKFLMSLDRPGDRPHARLGFVHGWLDACMEKQPKQVGQDTGDAVCRDKTGLE